MRLTFGLKIRLEDKTQYKSVMTEEIARRIKEIRQQATWRALASTVHDEYPKLEILPGNQLDGMQLCDSARAFLGEAIENGWN
jgi:hypothetical protein